jgi:hypothetical protein
MALMTSDSGARCHALSRMTRHISPQIGAMTSSSPRPANAIAAL